MALFILLVSASILMMTSFQGTVFSVLGALVLPIGLTIFVIFVLSMGPVDRPTLYLVIGSLACLWVAIGLPLLVYVLNL